MTLDTTSQNPERPLSGGHRIRCRCEREGMSDSELDIVQKILKAGRTASVTTRTATGVLHSRPLAIIDDDFDGTMWFFTAHPSAKTTDIAAHPDVNVSVGDSKGWLSMSGHA